MMGCGNVLDLPTRALRRRDPAARRRWALGDLGLERLEITCGPDNVGSRRVAERSGFRFEGRLRSHIPFKGHRRDSLLFSLIRQDLAAG